ncbi:abc transporter [Lucifera butyrica]|uniref:Abc transporter n=1 Tax=Lucifera butyrica TaxID=1351585 RepID=A0A498RCZ7_9FIRM|nr:ABC-F family ATP-binding cassette domain-containing protein [Lucifera butyrica]VBB09424.1 abc transporter [Lucifera butyrica]
MGVFKVMGLSKSFGVDELFSHIGFEIRRGDKIGLIGANGTGKTTLLRCLLGLERYDSGQIGLAPGDRIGYVEQDAGLDKATLYDELCEAYQDVLAWQKDMRRLEQAIAGEKEESRLALLMKEYARIVELFEQAGGYEVENTIRRVAYGLGFTTEDFGRSPAAFSGGQKTRIGLAKALLRQPDFLFLDEPTNHLDIQMVEWLEEFLASYPGGVLIVSHDRYFLDRVVGHILELENKRLSVYDTDYTGYLRQKAERMAALENAYEKQQAFIAKTEAYIDRYRAGIKSKQARGREKQLSRMERIVIPGEQARFNYFAFNPLGDCAERVAELQEVTAAYGERVVLNQVSLLIRRGDGVALVGPNGAGKTTLLKTLTGELAPAGGGVKLGSRVRVGYFAQEHETLSAASRVLDEIMQDFGLSEERSRHYLGAFLFRGDDVFKLVGDLSGGEKARLAMLKLMLSGANFLVLDEPTNHLDIPAKEAVEEALMSFPGTFLTVSHDRYFLDRVANQVVELAQGSLQEYSGNYSYYREKKAAEEKETAAAAAAKQEADVRTTAKTYRPRQRQQDESRQLKKLEEEIAALETSIAGLEALLNEPATHADPETSRELAAEYARQQADLEEKYNEWLERQ